MRPIFLRTLIPSILVQLVLTAALYSQSKNEVIGGKDAAANEVIVRLKDGDAKRISRMQVDYDLSSSKPISGVRGVYRFHSKTKSAAEMLDKLSRSPDVLYAEPNFRVAIEEQPNDPRLGELWGLHNYGQAYSFGAGTAGADIGAIDAWQVSTGSTQNVIAVIDTGVDYLHQDLAENMWTAPSSFKVVIGGVTVTCPAGSHGFNAILRTCDPMDDHYHGTHVAGTIGAVGNNSSGVVGVNWKTRIIASKFLDASGGGYLSDAIDAVEFLVQTKLAFAGTPDANIKVVSNSWGGGGFSQAFLDELNRANDMLFVFAAGNYSSNNDVTPFYPASYAAANLIAVAATDNRDTLATFSNYGKTSVHLAAPGVNILSTYPGQNYAYLSGTSMATPHVSGAANLVLSKCTLDLPALKADLLDNVDKVSALANITITGGRLNAAKAIRACSSSVWLSPSVIDFGTQNVSTSSAPRTTSLINNQSTPLTISSITATGDFSQSNDCGNLVAASGRCTIQVTFSPSIVGQAEGSLNVIHDGEGSPLSASLSGFGYQAPPIEISPNKIDFGTVVLSESSASTTVTLKNNLTRAVALLGITTSDEFIVTSGCGSAIAAGGTCSLAVKFVPSANGARTASISISFDAANSPQTVMLNGTGIARFTISPESLSFGRITIGKTSSVLPLVLTNNVVGTPLAISAISTTGDFAQTNTCGTSVPAESSCLIAVTFKPTQVGDRVGSVQVQGASFTASVPLTGFGMGLPDLAIASLAIQTTLPAAGGSLLVTDITTNLATGDADTFFNRFYLSSDGIKKGALLGSRYLMGLQGGTASEAVTSVFTIPAGIRGKYFVIACADDYNTVAEEIETNNCRASSSFAIAGADLLETQMDVKSAAFAAGGAVQVTDTAANTGRGAASSFFIRYFVSSDGVTKGSLLGSRYVMALGAGESSGPVISAFTLPTNIAGRTYVLGCADDYATVSEENEANNCRASIPFVIAGPDLAETQIELMSSDVAAGAPFQISDTTANIGQGNSGSFFDRYYLSTDGAKKGTLLGSRYITGLAAGSISGPVVSSYTIPAGLRGTYYVIACADDYNNVSEMNEANNCTTSRGFNIAAADLTESQVAMITSNLTSESTLQVSDTTNNVGVGSSGSFFNRFYLSVDGVKKGTLLGSRYIMGLNGGGASGPVISTFTIPGGTKGSYYLIACADDYQTVPETNESNNCGASAPFVIN